MREKTCFIIRKSGTSCSMVSEKTEDECGPFVEGWEHEDALRFPDEEEAKIHIEETMGAERIQCFSFEEVDDPDSDWVCEECGVPIEEEKNHCSKRCWEVQFY